MRTTSTIERDAWVEVDAGAIRHNLRLVRRLAGAAHVCVVCKADAYGFDVLLVARLAVECGMEAIACGDPADVLRLRAAGIALPILLYGVTSADALVALKPYEIIATAARLAIPARLPRPSTHLQHQAGCRLRPSGLPAA